ncbi:MAG: hypothetical protein HY960_05950 [Ignavibacteriae bacterium]|nr:hypothetical protein [Ignavibacteriota bacterium]
MQGHTGQFFGATGNGVEYHAYNAWGELMASQISPDVKYKYTGQEYDVQTGVYNYRARMYDEQLGRFYAMDPAGQGFSPYSYAGNNAVSFVDPDGKVYKDYWKDYYEKLEREEASLQAMRAENHRLQMGMLGGAEWGDYWSIMLWMADEVRDVSYTEAVYTMSLEIKMQITIEYNGHIVEVNGPREEAIQASAQIIYNIYESHLTNSSIAANGNSDSKEPIDRTQWLEFDGESLTWHYYATGLRSEGVFPFEGDDLIVGEYKALSGPYRKGKLPEGTYLGNGLRERTDKSAFICPAGGWSLNLEPMFRTDRTLLRIHPDGNVKGTEGCIGVHCSDSQRLYNSLLNYFQNYSNIRVDVDYR